jgi:hypothetical protein
MSQPRHAAIAVLLATATSPALQRIDLLTLRYLGGESHGTSQKGEEGGDLEGLHGCYRYFGLLRSMERLI